MRALSSRRLNYLLGWVGEFCAFEATIEILNSILDPYPQSFGLTTGDVIRPYRKSGYSHEWVVWWHAPSRHHSYRNRVFDQPDIVIYRNRSPLVAIEVKNWNRQNRISEYNVVVEMVKRFLSVPKTIPCVVLSTSVNFSKPQECRRLLEESHVDIRFVRNRPMPHRGYPEATIEEMRHILRDYVTNDRLMN